MELGPAVNEWLQLLLRWFHVFAAILWIGSTYFFTWLDGRLAEQERAPHHCGHPQVWMVHSGGFYVVEKQQGVQMLPRELHWFRWEAALTWISGMLLLAMVYYMGGLMVDADVAKISDGEAIVISLGGIVAGWAVYDLLWDSPLGRAEMAAGGICFLLVAAATYGLAQVFSGRAAYMQMGTMFGTIMAANVWMRILPAQRGMIASAKSGTPPDLALAARAKQRSKHNTFMVVPVVFIMISSHFPVATYGHKYNWAILVGLILLGWVVARLIRRA